jgi:insertion element IS1 protein InsB
VLWQVCPEQVEVELGRADELAQRHGLTSEIDEMETSGGKTAEPPRRWHAIEHPSGPVGAYVFGRRQAEGFVQLQALLEPFGLRRFYTDGGGCLCTAYRP